MPSLAATAFHTVCSEARWGHDPLSRRLTWTGIALANAAAVLLMSASTVVVALNAQLLRRVELKPSQ
ncbi:MAG: hypothetical protein WAN34_10740 [Acidimicrobiia bacterium]